MKVLMINGSPRINGATAKALKEMEKIFEEQKIEVEIVNVGTMSVRGCIACTSCYKTGKCVIDDIVKLVMKNKNSDSMEKLLATSLTNLINLMETRIALEHVDD